MTARGIWISRTQLFCHRRRQSLSVTSGHTGLHGEHPVSNRQMMAVGLYGGTVDAMNLTPAMQTACRAAAMGQGDICMMASKKNPEVYREGDVEILDLVLLVCKSWALRVADERRPMPIQRHHPQYGNRTGVVSRHSLSITGKKFGLHQPTPADTSRAQSTISGLQSVR